MPRNILVKVFFKTMKIAVAWYYKSSSNYLSFYFEIVDVNLFSSNIYGVFEMFLTFFVAVILNIFYDAFARVFVCFCQCKHMTIIL